MEAVGVTVTVGVTVAVGVTDAGGVTELDGVTLGVTDGEILGVGVTEGVGDGAHIFGQFKLNFQSLLPSGLNTLTKDGILSL